MRLRRQRITVPKPSFSASDATCISSVAPTTTPASALNLAMAPPKGVCGTDRAQLATAGTPQSVAERTDQRIASYQDRLQSGHLLEALHTDGVDGLFLVDFTETDMARQLGVLPLRVRQIMGRLQGGAQAATPLYSNTRQMPAQSTSLQRAAK